MPIQFTFSIFDTLRDFPQNVTFTTVLKNLQQGVQGSRRNLSNILLVALKRTSFVYEICTSSFCE
jgi:hypothetical protein